jgi:hypothetical protein
MTEEQRAGVSLQEAVKIAVNSVRDIYRGQGFELKDLMLEEVERSDDSWQVTVGFTRPNTATSDIGVIGQALAGPRRAFKRVRIDANTGEFLGMRIRELPASSSQTPQAR